MTMPHGHAAGTLQLAPMSHFSGRFGRSHGWRRRLVVALLLVLLTAAGTAYYLTRPERLARFAGSLLRDATGTRVHIHSASIDSDGTIHIDGLTLSTPEDSTGTPGATPGGEADRVFSAERVIVRHDIWSLLSGRFRAQQVTLFAPVIYVTQDLDTGQFNLQRLKKVERTSKGGGGIPEIFLREGAVRVGESRGGQYNQLREVRIEGSLMGVADEPGMYTFRLSEEPDPANPDARTGTRITGTFNIPAQTLNGKLEGFTIQSHHRMALPSRFREVWDRLEPSGSIPEVAFGYDPQLGLHALLELQHASLTIPYGEGRSPMTDVSGKLRLTRDKAVVENLAGKIEGMTYVLNGQIDGTSADAPFSLTLRVDPLIIPKEPRYMLAMPEAVQRGFQKISPSGSFKALVLVQRKEPGGKISYDGKVQIVKAQLTYSKFRYPLHDLEGEVRFNDDRVDVVSLRGRGPSGAVVTVDGSVAPPGDEAEVTMTVVAREVPVDEHLVEALDAKQRQVLAMFLDTQQHARLVELGHIRTSVTAAQQEAELAKLTARHRDLRSEPTRDADAIREVEARIKAVQAAQKIPLFDLGGRIALTATVHRPYGKDQKYTNLIRVTGKQFNALFRYWPYPLQLVDGELVIEPSSVTVNNIRGKGLTGGIGACSGRVTDIGSGKTFLPDLTITGEGIPLDEMLITSIPEPQNNWLRTLKLTGAINATGFIRRNEAGEVDFNVVTTMEDGRAQPNGGRYDIEKIKGTAHISRGIVELESIEGVHGDTAVTLKGGARWVGDQPSLRLDATAKGLRVEDPVLDLIPPGEEAVDRARKLMEEYKPSGLVDVSVEYTAERGKPSDFSVRIEPQTLAMPLQGRRIDMTKMGGAVTVTRTGLAFEELTGCYGEGRASVSGGYAFGDAPALDLTLNASNSDFTDTCRAAMPPYVARVIEGIELHGPYRLHDARLRWTPGDKGSLLFTGKVTLTRATATVGVPITDLSGEIDITASRAADAAWPSLDLKINAQSLRAAKRLISPLSLSIVSAKDPSALEIRDLMGDVYGGQFVGSGAIDLARGGRYRMAMTLQSARMDPFVYPDKYLAAAPAPTDGRPAPTGVLSAQLNIEGLPGDRRTTSGRGQLDVRNANMYELPMAMTLMQILNLSWPSSRAFDRASAQFALAGDDVRLDSVALEAPNLNIIGGGFMKYSTLALDLSLVTRNPRPVQLGPVGEIVSGVKDQFVNIRVTGTLDQPVTAVRSFNAISESWREIFGPGRKPEPQPQPQPVTVGVPSKSGQ